VASGNRAASLRPLTHRATDCLPLGEKYLNPVDNGDLRRSIATGVLFRPKA
jgi:hypothetical protein